MARPRPEDVPVIIAVRLLRRPEGEGDMVVVVSCLFYRLFLLYSFFFSGGFF